MSSQELIVVRARGLSSVSRSARSRAVAFCLPVGPLTVAGTTWTPDVLKMLTVGRAGGGVELSTAPRGGPGQASGGMEAHRCGSVTISRVIIEGGCDATACPPGTRQENQDDSQHSHRSDRYRPSRHRPSRPDWPATCWRD